MTTIHNRILFLFVILTVIFAITNGLFQAMAAPAWLPDAPSTDVGGVINSNTTWTLAGSPYVLTEKLTVTAGVTLTIEPGVVVMGEALTSLWMEGHLEAIGTVADPITFTSAANTGPDEWFGLYFVGGTGHLDHTVVRYTNGSGILVDGGPDAGPVIVENSMIQNNYGYALTVTTGNLHRLKLDNVSASDNGVDRVRIYPTDQTDNELTRDAQLTAVPGMEGYEFSQYGLKIPSGITLTIDPGVVMMSDKSSLIVTGHLEAVGTLSDPITFTSAADNAIGQWRGIWFDGGTGHLNHTYLRFAGQYSDPGIVIGAVNSIVDGPVTIENSFIDNNLAYPIQIYSGSLHQLQLNQVSFTNNGQNHLAVVANKPLAGNVILTNHPGIEAYELLVFSSPLVVPTGITLTLAPGVTLLMSDWSVLVEVFGHLEAVGTAVSPITLMAKTGLGMSERVPLSIKGSAHLDHVKTDGNMNIGVWEANGGPVLIENSTLSGSTFYPLFIGNDVLHRLQMSNVMFTDNITNRVAIEPLVDDGKLAGSVSLSAQPGLEGYQVTDILPESVPNLVIPSGLTLTLDPGVTFMGAKFGNLTVVGHLAAEGTAVSPVTFTSLTDIGPGEWGGLIISGTASLEHTIIRNGISNITLIGSGNEPVIITNSFVENGSSYAINAYVIALHRLQMDHVTFSGNHPDRVYVYPANGYELTENTELTGQPGLEGYEVNLASFVVPEGITLTLQPGATVMMKGGVIPVVGHLVAEGTADAPVTFTSDRDSGPGEWAGIVLEGGTAVLDHTQIRYSGKDGLSGIRVGGYVTDGGDLTLQNSSIISSTAAGLSAYSGKVTAVCSTFSNHEGDAIYADGSPDMTVFSSSISGNGSGVNNAGSTAVDARQNWWGDISGPGGDGPGSGGAVWGNVMYDPWLKEPTCNLTPYQQFLPVVIRP